MGFLRGRDATNPSLLEALSCTDLNLLLDVGFNREVGADSALYWKKKPGSLAALIERADAMPKEEKSALGRSAKSRVAETYTWEKVCEAYEKLFLRGWGEHI